MSKKASKENRRKRQIRKHEQAKKARTAVVHNDEGRTVIMQGGTKGYDVEMIRDFLDHLLLEMRVQHCEQLKFLKSLDESDDLEAAKKATALKLSDEEMQQFLKFQTKYQSALVFATVLDKKDASEAEATQVAAVIMKEMKEKRDEQIGHLEALQELFEEALLCATTPFGSTPEGILVEPQRHFRVREITDHWRLSGLPTYEDLLPLHSDHEFATEEGIELLQNHDKDLPIAARRDDRGDLLRVYSPDLAIQRQQAEKGNATIKVRVLSVTSYSELQFVIAAIVKFVGTPCTDGTAWEDWHGTDDGG